LPNTHLSPYTTLFRSKLRQESPSWDWKALDTTDWNRFLIDAPSNSRDRLTKIFLGKAPESSWRFSVQFSEQMLTEWDRDAQGRRSEEHTSELQSHLNL